MYIFKKFLNSKDFARNVNVCKLNKQISAVFFYVNYQYLLQFIKTIFKFIQKINNMNKSTLIKNNKEDFLQCIPH